jgi:hypothetical protein
MTDVPHVTGGWFDIDVRLQWSVPLCLGQPMEVSS